MAKPRVLITGFGPFPGVPDNPSSWLARTLEKQAAFDSEAELHFRVLPTEWQAAALMPDFYATLQPALMIHFGLNQRAQSLRIERSAHNRAGWRADACGALPLGRVIHAKGPDRIDTAVPVRALAAHLRRSGLPATTSPSAGSYLCNFIYYHSLAWARWNDCHPLFVHLPPVQSRGHFSKAMLLRAAQAILRFMLNAAPAQAHAGASSALSIASTEALMPARDA
jgi:pyroglutamyl-peptidase